MLGNKSVNNEPKNIGNNKLKMNQKKFYASMSLLLIVVVLGLLFMVFNNNIRSDNEAKIEATLKADGIHNLEGRYYYLYVEGKLYCEVVANSEDKTTGEWVIKRNSDDEIISTYEYRIENEKIIVDEYEYETEYTVFKNYLVPEEYTFDGIIPKGKTFDAICTYSGDNTKIEFRNNGRVGRTYDDESDVGTYERKGDVITCKIEDEEKVIKYLIFNNQINDSAYFKEED